MHRLMLICFLILGIAFNLPAQSYYVAIVKGEVFYQDQLLKRRDKIELGGELRFSSADDYVKVSGPGGLHIIYPQGKQPNRKNEFLVSVRQELFPEVRMRATVANNISVITEGRYFGLEGKGGRYLFPQHYSIDSVRLSEAEALGLLHATSKGLVWEPLILENGDFTIDSTTFQLPDNLQIDSSAIVLVRDHGYWDELMGQFDNMEAISGLVGAYYSYLEGPGGTGNEGVSQNEETMDNDNATKVEILDYLRPFEFVNPRIFFEDMRFHVEKSGARTSSEFIRDQFYDEYIREVYSSPIGSSGIIDALVPDPDVRHDPYHGKGWSQEPLKVGIIGLVHTHVHWLLGREDRGDIDIVGIVEPNRDLATRYCEQYGIPLEKVYDTKEELMALAHPEAVTGFNTTYDHLELVEYFAPRKVHIMVEKPLAVNLAQAERMVKLAKEHGVHLLTNYETTWYGSNEHARQMLQGRNNLGDLTRLLFYTGHPGPTEIGCNIEFLDWLTDPVLNGGGALPDFGCYGANLTTWLLEGAEPIDVTCVLRQTKPNMYPKVEDDATIMLNYPNNIQVVIQASWNWSHSRKEMELYATDGYIYCRDGQHMEQKLANEEKGTDLKAEPLPVAVNDPFAYLHAVVKKGHEVKPWDLSAPENNIRVMQILDAAKFAASEGRTVSWEEFMAQAKAGE
ncbi:MAG: Gfo/Idh/MocA family oxidoreductase [Mameliella sp.]|nr:Gfo/Idh/MocA family oxidoreductase [Phaeodactylibacter sp.]